METLAAMFCVFLVIVQTREDMVLIKRVPEISLLELLRQKLMFGNMDYEDDNNSGPKSRANPDSGKVVNTSYQKPRMLHNNPYEYAPDPLFNPYHVRHNLSHHHYKPLHNPGYASFHPVRYRTAPPEDSKNPIFAPQHPAYVQFPQRIHLRSQDTILPPKEPLKFDNKLSNFEPYPYPLDEVSDVPSEPPPQQEPAVTPRQRLFGDAENPAQYSAYRYIPTKKSTLTDTVDTFQTHSKNREKPLIPGKIVNSDTDNLFNQQATPPISMEIWRGEDDMTTEKTFSGFKLASGISSIILSSFEEDYKMLKTLEKTGLVERNPDNLGNSQKEVVAIKSNPKIPSTIKKQTDMHPKIIDNRNTLERKEVKSTMKVKKKEEEVDLEALLKKAIKRAEERIPQQPLSFQSYENGSYPFRRTFDRVRWKHPELV